mmetsp:Transcript_8355/g.23218  ORF Transcript_8355/g.23218 Transcript_8355/m.23218 type:complete len:204 (+) Transcript_8355:404-1015(+)
MLPVESERVGTSPVSAAGLAVFRPIATPVQQAASSIATMPESTSACPQPAKAMEKALGSVGGGGASGSGVVSRRGGGDGGGDVSGCGSGSVGGTMRRLLITAGPAVSPLHASPPQGGESSQAMVWASLPQYVMRSTMPSAIAAASAPAAPPHAAFSSTSSLSSSPCIWRSFVFRPVKLVALPWNSVTTSKGLVVSMVNPLPGP